MLPNGELFARVVAADAAFRGLQTICVTGEDLLFSFHCGAATRHADAPDLHLRARQAFGEGTIKTLNRLRAAVVGCSGTGSIVVEQLARLGIGELVLVDPDVVEPRNLDRILHATPTDAAASRLKVEVLGDAIERMGLGTRVLRIGSTLASRQAVEAVGACDVVFGCVDGYEGRDLLGRLAAFYLLPYLDIGVRLEADGHGGIEQVVGTVHYVKPGGATLRDRGVFGEAEVRSEALRRSDPGEYERQRKEKYVKGIDVDRPAVISVNMFYAALAVNEFLARLHPFKTEANGDCAEFCISLSAMMMVTRRDEWRNSLTARVVGRGDLEPRLDMPSLSL
jgi:hypothetical protein